MNRYKWKIVAVAVLGLNLGVWLTHCAKPTVDPVAVIIVDSGASVAVGIPDAATLADAVSPVDAATPVTQ